jgi:hypothetical protein
VQAFDQEGVFVDLLDDQRGQRVVLVEGVQP